MGERDHSEGVLGPSTALIKSRPLLEKIRSNNVIQFISRCVASVAIPMVALGPWLLILSLGKSPEQIQSVLLSPNPFSITFGIAFTGLIGISYRVLNENTGLSRR